MSETIPCPSRTSNCFVSTPRSSMMIRPSVNTPSTSSRSNFISWAFFRTAAEMRFTGWILKAGLKEIVEMNDTKRRAIILENKKTRNGVLFHERDGFRGERISRNGFGISGHKVLGAVSENIPFIFQAASQVAVGDNPSQFPRSIDHPSDPQSLRCDLEKRILNGSVFGDQRKFLAAMH